MPSLPSGRVDDVVPDRDPGVRVRQAPGAAPPRPDGTTVAVTAARGRHPGPSSHGPGGRVRGGAGPYPRSMQSRPAPSAPGPRASPSRRSRRCATSGSRCSDGLELSANLWLPEPLADGPAGGVPGDPRDAPVPEGRLARGQRRGRGEWLAARGYAFCRLDVRGTGSSPGIALDEYTARETQDGADAVEWLAAPGLVERPGRDVGDLVRRLHRDPGRDAPPAAPRGDRPDDGDRRPLHRRRPLPRRLHDGVRAEPVRGEHGRDERDAAAARRTAARRGSTSGATASSGRRSGSSSGSASSTTGPTGGRARSPRTGTRSTTPMFLDRRLDGRVRRRRAADAGALHERAAAGARSATGSTPARTTRTRARTSTGTTRWSGSSTTG